MTHVYQLSDVKVSSPTVLAIGVFDGVHLGHQSLLNNMIKYAKEHDFPSVVVTFYPSPSVALGKCEESSYIHSPNEKASLLHDLGIDFVLTMNFNQKLAKMTPESFIMELRNQIDFRYLWCSNNFAFGKARQGNINWLHNNSDNLGFKIIISDPVLEDGKIVSSSRVRNQIMRGDVVAASRCLGRPLSIPGTIVKGSGRGNSIGFPTANLSIWERRACPSKGVYVANAILKDKHYPAVVNIGIRPTFDNRNNDEIIEAHLIGFSDDIYGKNIILEFLDRLRDEQKFENVNLLIDQINKDVLETKSRLIK